MPKNEEGEYELVLGNRQLLSIVFIIMVLGGVVFSLGYFLGRSSAPDAPSPVAAAQPAPAPEPAGLPGAAAASPIEPPPLDTPLEPGQVKVAPATAPVGGPPAEPAPKPEETPVPPAPPPQRPSDPTLADPAPGQTFLQVAAVKRPEAELIVDVLKKKGFAAMIAPGPSETVFRVLVGPFTEANDLGKTKLDLEAAGFKSIVRKY